MRRHVLGPEGLQMGNEAELVDYAGALLKIRDFRRTQPVKVCVDMSGTCGTTCGFSAVAEPLCPSGRRGLMTAALTDVCRQEIQVLCALAACFGGKKKPDARNVTRNRWGLWQDPPSWKPVSNDRVPATERGHPRDRMCCEGARYAVVRLGPDTIDAIRTEVCARHEVSLHRTVEEGRMTSLGV